MGKQRYTNAAIIKALKDTKGMIYLAARQLGCHPDTIFKRAKKHPQIQTAIDAARGEVVDTAELALYNAILAKEHWAIAFALRTIGKHRGYTERQEVTGADGDELVFRVTYGNDRSKDLAA